MRKRIAALSLSIIAMLILLTGCGGEKAESYDGEFSTSYPLSSDAMIFNILGEPKKYVNCKVTLEVDDATIITTFDARIHRVKEIVNLAISAKTREELDPPEAKITLAEEIAAKINEEFNTTAVQKVYFEEFFIYG